MKPTVGRILLYKLTAGDADQINRRRTSSPEIAKRIERNTPESSAWPIGAQAHIGNQVDEGEVYPMIVTRVWSDTCVNGQVILDGNDCLWATSATEGDHGHCWQWPPRAPVESAGVL